MVKAKSDSQLIGGQVSGEYEAEDDYFRMYIAKTQEFFMKLTQFSITHIPKFEKSAGWHIGSDGKFIKRVSPSRTIMWEVLHQPSINAKEQFMLIRTSTWMKEVVKYMKDGILLEGN